MMSMALMDKVISIDKEKMQVVVQCGAQLLEHGFIHSFFQNHISPTIIPIKVTVQAGCRVQQLVDALKPHGLTLQVCRTHNQYPVEIVVLKS